MTRDRKKAAAGKAAKSTPRKAAPRQTAMSLSRIPPHIRKVDPKNEVSHRAAAKLKGMARLKPLDQTRVHMRSQGINFGYLAGLAQGRSFSLVDVPAMLEDDQVALGLHYLKIPIQQAKCFFKVGGMRGQEALPFVNDLHQRVWNRLVSKTDLLMSFGYCCFEPLYRKDAQDSHYWDFVDFDVAPPAASVPWITNDRLAFAAVHQDNYGLSFTGYMDAAAGLDGCSILEGAGKFRPSKALWLSNDPLLSRWFGRSVLRAAHYRWKMKTMPDGLLENLAKANYKAAFSGLLIKYPAHESIVMEDGSVKTAEEYADFMCQCMKTGSNVRLPASPKDALGWEIVQYAQNLVDMQQLIAPLDYADRAICRGMGVPDELLTHQGNTGGYSRSEISMGMFTAKGETRAADWLPQCIEAIYNPLVRQRFGSDCEVSGIVIPGSLMAQQGQGQPGQGDPNDIDGDGVPDSIQGMVQGGQQQPPGMPGMQPQGQMGMQPAGGMNGGPQSRFSLTLGRMLRR
jgi:hypothetical protein